MIDMRNNVHVSYQLTGGYLVNNILYFSYPFYNLTDFKRFKKLFSTWEQLFCVVQTK